MTKYVTAKHFDHSYFTRKDINYNFKQHRSKISHYLLNYGITRMIFWEKRFIPAL